MFYWITNTGEVGCTDNPAKEPLKYGIKNQYTGTSPIAFIILTKTNVFMFGQFNGLKIETTSVKDISLTNKGKDRVVYYIDVDEEQITSPLVYLQNNIANLDNFAVIFPNIDKNKAFSIDYTKADGFKGIKRNDNYARLCKLFDNKDKFTIPFYDNEFLFVAHTKTISYCNVFNVADELVVSIQI